MFDKKKFLVYTLPVLLAVIPSNSSALDPEHVKLLIIDRAVAHGVNPALMLCVDEKESRFNPSSRGSRGEYGVAQWLPGRRNAWDETSAYKVSGIDIANEYNKGNANAPYFDIDAQAELFAKGRIFRQHHWASTLADCE